MALVFENLYSPTFPEFPDLVTVPIEFRLEDDTQREVKKVIIETQRLQLKKRIGKGSPLTSEEIQKIQVVVNSL